MKFLYFFVMYSFDDAVKIIKHSFSHDIFSLNYYIFLSMSAIFMIAALNEFVSAIIKTNDRSFIKRITVTFLLILYFIISVFWTQSLIFACDNGNNVLSVLLIEYVIAIVVFTISDTIKHDGMDGNNHQDIYNKNKSKNKKDRDNITGDKKLDLSLKRILDSEDDRKKFIIQYIEVADKYLNNLISSREVEDDDNKMIDEATEMLNITKQKASKFVLDDSKDITLKDAYAIIKTYTELSKFISLILEYEKEKNKISDKLESLTHKTKEEQ